MNSDNYKQKMTKYDNGKIYKIESDLGDLIYIGSTTKERLSSRLAQHVYVYRNKPKDGALKKGKSPNYTSTILFDKYGVENCKIILIENYSCLHIIYRSRCRQKCILICLIILPQPSQSRNHKSENLR